MKDVAVGAHNRGVETQNGANFDEQDLDPLFVENRSRILLDVEIWIRICIKVMRIRNPF